MSTLTFMELITENRLLLLTALIVTWISFKLSQLLLIYLKYTVGVWCFSKRKTLRQAGEWAVVTGASSGIGQAYAEELAKEGLNVMLISNDEKQLSSVADQITNTYNVQTRIVVADFTKNDVYEIIRPAVDQLSTIACLVNNVGMVLPFELFAGEVHSPNEESIKNIIHCNILSTVIMTSIILPKMLTQKGPNPGIINIASYTALKVAPYLTIYPSTKAFIIQFSRCLAAEKYRKNVIVQTLYPLFVSTNLTGLRKATYFTPSAKVYAKSALDMFGVEQQTTGYFPHELKAFVYNLMPTSLWNDTYDIIRPAIDQLSTIACLVNNVGMGLPLELFTGEIGSPNQASIQNIIRCNILSTVMMTSIILPKMLTQKGSNPGIINIASYSALRTTPYLTVYSSTKAFIIQFCKCLAAEKYKKNVIIQILCPLTIYTSMTKHEKPSYFNPSAKLFVHSALNMYGVVQQTTGYILHEYKAYLFDLLPTSLWILLTYARVNARKKYV